jgi:hypothetical protein
MRKNYWTTDRSSTQRLLQTCPVYYQFRPWFDFLICHVFAILILAMSQSLQGKGKGAAPFQGLGITGRHL